MNGRYGNSLGESSHALREVYRNRSLRRLQLAWAGSIIGSWAYSVALVVYAYDAGGASAVGLVGLIRWLPAAIASPFAVGARRPLPPRAGDARRRPLRAAALGGMAGVRPARRGRPPSSTCSPRSSPSISTAFQPAQAALLPVARAHARGADRRQRQLEHAREPRLLRRPRPRRPAARRLDHVGRLRGDRRDVPLVGVQLSGLLRPTSRRCEQEGERVARPRGGRRLPGDRGRPAPAARDRALLGADAGERRDERPDRRLRARAAATSAPAGSAT